MPGALDGLIVLDLTSHLSGPYCTMLLADMGADVIKVERPGKGDDSRSMPPFVDGIGAPYALWNRNKRSIALDPKNPEDRAALHALAQRADILVENMRPGALARMGLDYATLSKTNPRLIVCSISGFGQTGPWSEHGGFDLMTQAMSGLMAGNGPIDGEPTRLPIAISDVSGGMFAAIGILGALNARAKTGRGQKVEASLFESALAFGVYEAALVLGTGQRPQRMGQAHRGSAPYQAFESSDGWLTIGAGQDHFFKPFCRLLGLESLAEDARFATNALRVANNIALMQILAEQVRQQPTAHWLEALEEIGIPAEPVLNYDEALAHPQARSLGVVADIPGATRGLKQTLAPAVHLSETRSLVRRPAPGLDEHGAEIRAWLSATA
ncbi:CaiB/BaiF CoA transferase family protein [Plastoroseomonas arctica]|uniref:CoA transferase n=1 Tax=Plastoroseomonas arctica TaxID=1509237 RepID=A0AAF1JVF0_9PROT|nr:CoA transferase [Plastoroseomonas arctica]MBR0654571.1 CoA transferase [Plastoroseomonas arctica]